MDLANHLLSNVSALILVLSALLLVLSGVFAFLAVAGRIESKWVILDFSSRPRRIALLGFALVFMGSGIAPLLSNFLSVIQQALGAGSLSVIGRALSDFPSEYGRNDYGQEWGIFNDSRWKGRSTIWYEMRKRTDGDDYYLSAHFNLVGIKDAYCGLQTNFSTPPYRTIDLSQFEGIKFKARYSTSTPDKTVRFFLQVAQLGVPNFSYHELEFMLSANEAHFTAVRVPFSRLRTPAWSSEVRAIDISRIFRFSLIIKGSETSGQIDLDSFRLFGAR
jgi:hypothetical protein